MVINVHESRCDALILHSPGTIIHVALPNFSLPDARRLYTQLRSVLIQTRHLPTRFPSGVHRADNEPGSLSAAISPTGSRFLTAQVGNILGELWTRVVKLIIDSLPMHVSVVIALCALFSTSLI